VNLGNLSDQSFSLRMWEVNLINMKHAVVINIEVKMLKSAEPDSEAKTLTIDWNTSKIV
jgi:hypothetical protein